MAGNEIEYKVTKTQLDSVADAINAKAEHTGKLAFPAEFISTIESIPTGGGSGGTDVVFYDYDGSVVTSYSAADFASLAALPENPTHTGLTSHGWNWSLADAKTYVAKYGKLNIGQMYVTDDGTTRIYIHLEQGRTSPMLGVCPNGTVDVNWGDGTAHDTLTGTSVSTVVWTSTHNYAAPGDFVIKLTVTGSMGFYGTSGGNTGSALLRYSSDADNRNYIYRNTITKVEIGSNITSIGSNAFNNCSSLSSVVIPDGVTSIGDYAFQKCYSFSSIIVPDSVTSIGRNAFYYCYFLSSTAIPDGITSIGDYAFNSCYSLSSVVVPEGVMSIGTYAFINCSSLSFIVIPDSVTSIGEYAFNACFSLSSITIPDSVKSIGSSAFSYCYALSSITIRGSVTSIGNSAFNNCSSLSSIAIRGSVTSIGNSAFNACSSLSSITIPDSVKSIGRSAFSYCYALSSITIPDSVTSISGSAFASCYSVKEYHILPTTPPTLANTNAFTNIPADCIIYVPVASLEAYQSATNWSTYASKMQGE